MLKGSCLCGAVRFVAEGPLKLMACCHCVQCRKASGAEFASNATVKACGFQLLAGESALKEYESSPGNFRVFCHECGSPLYARSASHPAYVRLRLGCLDTEFDERPLCHIFVSEKPNWSKVSDDLPTFDTVPEKIA